MNATHTRTKVVRAAAVAAALAASLSACTHVTPGTVVMGDLGPCTHVNAPMVDIPTSGAEPQLRIPEPAGWAHSPELEELDATVRFAIADSGTGLIQHGAAVMVERVPDADPQTIFDDFEAHMVQFLEEEGIQTDLTTTAGTLCGLPSATIKYAVPVMSLGTTLDAMPAGDATNLLVVTESGGDTYLVAVVQTNESHDPKFQRDAETILTGFEVLPQTETTA